MNGKIKPLQNYGCFCFVHRREVLFVYNQNKKIKEKIK
jgi:hypothetical protein